MEYTLNPTVKSLDHEDLVDLFSTALTGCNWTIIDYNRKTWESLSEKTEDPCIEDIIADVLLAGHPVYITDIYADGDRFGEVCESIKKQYGHMEYVVNLDRLIETASTETGFSLLKELYEGDGDYYTANNFLQLAMFGEIVY